MLYRAGDLLQQIFYVYREKVFDRRLAKIEKKGSKLYVYDADLTEAYMKKPLTIHRLFAPFPEKVCETIEDKQAVLVQSASEDGIAWLHDIAKHILTGISSSIAEVCLIPKNPHQKIVRMDGIGAFNTVDQHVIWVVKPKDSDEEYAIDISGAQFGHYEPVTPWSHYRDCRVLMGPGKPPVFKGFGGCLASIKDRLPPKTLPDHDKVWISHSLRLAVSDRLMGDVLAWEKARGTVMDMLGATKIRDFENKRDELVRAVGEGLDAWNTEFKTTLDKIKAAKAA
ncbi:hypothetical protein BKA64DRAFT_759242 [Cadophora sp. MPI-SDFR-AT-0126]|nr:hypothetical protein BKA64DRAFT_759242 [Leotiomycetes sp. MPI-SDFR-AT-0126]